MGDEKHVTEKQKVSASHSTAGTFRHGVAVRERYEFIGKAKNGVT